jgi:hypothetical protein
MVLIKILCFQAVFCVFCLWRKYFIRWGNEAVFGSHKAIKIQGTDKQCPVKNV